MYEKLDCIALRLVKHTDRNAILNAYTRQRGRLSFLVSAGQGREAARRRALLMPGSRFSCVSDIRDSAGLSTMRDVAGRGVNAGVNDPVKSAITLFVTDFINTFMRDAPVDVHLFDYCDGMLAKLVHQQRGVANYHLLFLVGMMHFAGIEPDTSTYRQGTLFDMSDGIFRNTAPLHGRYLDREESALLIKLMRMNHRNLHLWRVNATNRNDILDRLMDYYSLHFASLRSMRSLDVLRTLF